MNKKDLLSAYKFISTGFACYAIALLDKLGFIDILLNKGSLSQATLKNVPNQTAIEAALLTLTMNDILKKSGKNYLLTAFGSKIIHQRGFITLFYDGYRFILANQNERAANKRVGNLDPKAIVRASILLSDNTIDQLVVDIIKDLQIKGTICDLGCGDATRLIDLCRLTGTKGIGIEASAAAIKLAKTHLNGKKSIIMKKADITDVKGCFPDVELLMQFSVMHDITPTAHCRKVIDSYRKNFPHMKYFLYVDHLRSSPALNTQIPGFDYIHGLLGIHTRTYEETIEMFKSSSFEIHLEKEVKGLPNTFLWLLQPRPD